jgi:hypothetical protein
MPRGGGAFVCSLQRCEVATPHPLLHAAAHTVMQLAIIVMADYVA